MLLGIDSQKAEKSYCQWSTTVNMAKTQIPASSYGGSCTFRFKSTWDDDQAGLNSMQITGCGLVTASATYMGEVEGGHRFDLTITPMGDFQTIVVPKPDYGDPPIEIEWHFAFHLDGAIVKEVVGGTPIGSKSYSTHAKEMSAADQWIGADDSSIHCTWENLSVDVPVGGVPALLQMGFVGRFDTDHWGDCGSEWGAFADIAFSGADVDTSAYGKHILTDPDHPDCYAEGVGSGYVFYGPNYLAAPYTYGLFTSSINAPLQYDFSGLSVADMDNDLLSDLEIWCSGVRNIDTINHIDLGPVKKTLDEWRATSLTQKYGVVSGDVNPPDLLPTVYFWIDKDSAQAHNLEGFAVSGDCSDVSHDHDGRIEVEGWLLSSTDRSSAPWRSDIASIEHLDDVSIYANALEHTDWVGEGATVPDAGGNFQVSEIDGKLTLELPSNYIARQAAVGSVGAIPIPEAYWRRKNGYFYGQGNPVEGWEAVYCWLGWSYLYFDMVVPPTLTEVTLTIEYYSDETFQDNHLSDSTRQSSYNYSSGELHTATCTKAITVIVEGRAQFTFDLMDLVNGVFPPLGIVKSVSIAFDVIGNYQFSSEPTLVLDKGTLDTTCWIVSGAGSSVYNGTYVNSGMTLYGNPVYWKTTDHYCHLQIYSSTPPYNYWILIWWDGQNYHVGYYNGTTLPGTWYNSEGHLPAPTLSNPGRPASTPHCWAKEFEHFAYKDGGMSAHTDGIFHRAIWWPDQYKPNTLEKDTGGHLNPLYGAESGIDFTTAFSLAAYLSLIGTSGDAWYATYDSLAADDATVDADDVVLKILDCYDLRPRMVLTGVMDNNIDGGVELDVALRVGQWTAVPGLQYVWHTDKFIGGQGHGRASDSGRDRSDTDFTSVWRRELGSDDEWLIFEADVDSDNQGHWHSQSGMVEKSYASNVATRYEYAVGPNSTNPTSIGCFATREFAVGTTYKGMSFFVVEQMRNVVYVLEYQAGVGIRLVYSSPPDQWYDTGVALVPYTLPHTVVTDTDGSPSGYVDRLSVFYMYHVKDGDLKRLISRDWGNHWVNV
jgi:hypothetical protein